MVLFIKSIAPYDEADRNLKICFTRDVLLYALIVQATERKKSETLALASALIFPEVRYRSTYIEPRSGIESLCNSIPEESYDVKSIRRDRRPFSGAAFANQPEDDAWPGAMRQTRSRVRHCPSSSPAHQRPRSA